MNTTALQTAIDSLQKPGALFRLERTATSGGELPDQIRLTIDAPLIRGGGLLVLDRPQGRFAGTLSLQLPAFSISAIVLLTPLNSASGPEWTQLIILAGQWPTPIPLLYGFTLSGVGGLVGLHRGIDTDRILSDLQCSATDVLCPSDPSRQLVPLIQRLDVLFPVRPGSLTLGPMLILGWGIPNLLQARLAVLVQLDDVLNRSTPALRNVLVLGQLEARLPAGLAADKSLLRLLVDVTGSLDLVEKTFGLTASLRDSRIGLVGLQGMLVVRAGWGDHPTFVLAAGGFHPRFRDVPAGLPAPIDRVGARWSIGGASLTLSGYFAVTPATVQAGGRIYAEASACGATVAGEFSFDTLFEFEPDFHFEIDASCSVTARWHSREFCGVRLSGTLTGPGRWTFRGKASFDVWLTTITVSVNESWGSAPLLPAPEAVNLVDLLLADVTNPDRWRAPCAAGVPEWISLVGTPDAGCVLAHPSGVLTFSQNRFPLDLDLAHVGRAPITGNQRVSIEAATLNGQPAVLQPVLEAFARSAFVGVTAEQRLTGDSFEQLPAGVALSSTKPIVRGLERTVPLTYELGYACLDESEIPQDAPSDALVPFELFNAQVAYSPLARARWRFKERAGPPGSPRLTVTGVPLTVVDIETLAPTKSLAGARRYSQTLARQDVQKGAVLEAYEATRLLR